MFILMMLLMDARVKAIIHLLAGFRCALLEVSDVRAMMSRSPGCDVQCVLHSKPHP